ncbi:hypothetical protein JW813_08335 [Clostridium botulinum]|uniref:Imm48 family immunity protein n=1 Tax=Clostridium TaxID=1485 RepID=UPI0020797B0C|nr:MULTISPECIES: Imm48 family immunity protein [Clostridium]MBN1051996.1 hypothetical protein [Clostridium botulinum]UZP05001.1 hypothetical protein JW813_08335 [Clostridium botulinum]UZP08411.1 hypothetical protein JYA71_08605 [Clostridium botulinum]UZP11739.1 hypothetical protein JYA74_08330 [Clostridium botulinum]
MQENIFLQQCENLIQNLLKILEVKLEELTEEEKKLLIAYSFGMISIMADENHISHNIKYFAIKKTIMKVFKYSKQETNDILKELINSIKKGGNEVFNIMIHQGKLVYNKYKANNYNEVYDKLTNMIDFIVSKEYLD